MRGDDLPQGEQPDLDPYGDGRGPGPSPRALLIAAVLMVVVGYFLIGKLREMSQIQDCVMSGRHNCAPIETGDKK